MAEELQQQGHDVSQRTVCDLLAQMEYSLQSTRKTREGGQPLISRQVVVNLIGSTTTREGLRIKAGIDENTYAKEIKVSDEELATLAIERDEFHGEWNYRLLPRDRHAQL